VGRKGLKQGKHDWLVIRKDYVEGWQNGEGRHLPTLQELSKKHHCTVDSLFKRSAKDGWTEARQAFTRKVTAIQAQKSATELALYGVGFDRRVVSLANRITTQIARCVSVYEPSDAGPPPLADPLVLQRLAAALVRAHFVAHAAIGDAPGIEFEDLVRDTRKRVLIHTIPKPPPTEQDDDGQDQHNSD